jgi:thiamine-phosphate pyrophosphorylase
VHLAFPSIYPITDRAISGLPILEQVRRLIAGGAKLIQIREKGADVRSFMDDAAAGVRYARERGVRVIVNDRIDLAMVLEADGVHLGQDDLPPAEARRLLGPDAIIGYSTHTVEQARKAMELPIDYLAFGPVFPTSTKERPDAVVGTEVLSEIAKLAGKLPLVAIGGINESNLERTLSSGATSAAIISGLLSDPDRIEETLRRMLSRHGKLTNSV